MTSRLLDERYVEVHAVKGSDWLGVLTTLRGPVGVQLEVVNISLRVSDPEDDSREVILHGSLLGGQLSYNEDNGEIFVELPLGDLLPREASRHYYVELIANIADKGSYVFCFGKLFVRDTVSEFSEDEDPILDSEDAPIL